MKAIAHMLLVIARGVKFETVACAASIDDDRGGAGKN